MRDLRILDPFDDRLGFRVAPVPLEEGLLVPWGPEGAEHGEHVHRLILDVVGHETQAEIDDGDTWLSALSCAFDEVGWSVVPVDYV